MLNFVQGDMFEGDFDIRVNTVNCVGVMGTGVALAFKTRYPEMYRAYKKACAEGRIQPGKIDVWRTFTEWVINFPTKRHWRNKSRYEDIESGLESLRTYLESAGRVRVALPALGCGHGGLDWRRVASMIQSKLDGIEAEVFVFEPADSRTVGEKVSQGHKRAAGEPELDWRVLESESKFFPSRYRTAGLSNVSVIGSDLLLEEEPIAVFCSASPTAREKASAIACVEALARPGVTFSFNYEDRLSPALATVSLQNDAHVILWTAQGAAQIDVPAKLSEYVRSGRLAIVTIAQPSMRWTRPGQERTQFTRALVAGAILLTAPEKAIPLSDSSGRHVKCPIFYVWYGGTNQRVLNKLNRIGARRIGKNRETGTPNVAPMLEGLVDTRAKSIGGKRSVGNQA